MENELEIYLNGIRRGWLLRMINNDIKLKYPEICIEGVKLRKGTWKDVPEEVRAKYPDIYVESVKHNGKLLEDVPYEIMEKYPQICIDALKTYSEAIRYVPVDIQIANPQICVEYILQNEVRYLINLPKKVREECPEIYLEVAKKIGGVLLYVPYTIETKYPQIYKEICIESVKNNPDDIRNVNEDIKIECPEMCMEALKQNSSNLFHIPEIIQERYSFKSN